LWQAGSAAPACPLLARPPLYQTGVLPYARPGSLDGLASAEALFGPSHYAYHEGVNTLPVIVLVDDRTGSSSEAFAAWLQDSHAAVIAGQPTAGAGCGFTDGGIPTVLRRSGAQVKLPDCVRLRADGTDDVAGVTPDVLLPFARRDSAYQRAIKTRDGLVAAWRMARSLSRAAGHPTTRPHQDLIR
jgi:C-terminal processing protease CtpA/Prc